MNHPTPHAIVGSTRSGEAIAAMHQTGHRTREQAGATRRFWLLWGTVMALLMAASLLDRPAPPDARASAEPPLRAQAAH